MIAAKTTTMPMMANMSTPPPGSASRHSPQHRCPVSACHGCWLPWPARARSSSCASVSCASPPACAAPMLTVSETRSPHQRKSAVRARPGQSLRMRGQHLRAALVRHDQKLIVAPAAHLLAGRNPCASACRTFSSIALQAPHRASCAVPPPDPLRSTKH